MHPKRADGAAGRLGLLLVALACLQVSPARAAQVVERVDPLVVRVSASFLATTYWNLSRTQIAELCGDGDGCTLRLVLELVDGTQKEMQHGGRYFVTSDDAAEWSVAHDPVGGGGFTEGSLDDGDHELIYQLQSDPSVGHCSFRERHPPLWSNATYSLSGSPNLADAVDCTLKIED